MSNRRGRLLSLLALTALGTLWSAAPLLAQGDAGPQGAGTAYSIELPGTIDPATERWIDQALGEAEDEGAEVVIIRLDTPGGLSESMRAIVKKIIAAPMPVVVYVSPDGARAASAGLFVTEAADVAAMAPQTNIGSATPISIGPGGAGEIDDTLGRKIENDAAAYVRALAAAHDRNADLAERMVRDATNVTASEALDAGLVDVIAPDQQQLLTELDGFRVRGPKAGTLDTAGLEIHNRDMPLQFDLLQILVNPNVSFLLLLIGLAGIGLEIFNPGTIVPGAIGGISLLLGLYGTAQVPVAIAGILLLLLGIGLIIAETQVPGGVLGAAGVVSLGAAGLLLYDTNSDSYAISPPVVIVVTAAVGLGALLVARKVLAARRLPVMGGSEELIGAEAEVRHRLDPEGQVFFGGTLWRARRLGDGGPIEAGDRVRVESVEGLTLRVRPLGAGADAAASEAGQEGAHE